MFWLAAFTLGFWLIVAGVIARGNRRMRRLTEIKVSGFAATNGKNGGSAQPPRPWPRVSVVFAARNEGKTLGAAVPTMLEMDYPDFEIIAVNDRSDDDTGAVLARLAATDARLRVADIRELPSGWIGKNHALHHGAARATGEWILFTDADIHFQPQTIRRAVSAAVNDQLDFLGAVPTLSEHGHRLGICVNAFSFCYTIALRPWRIPNPDNHAHGGVGAFGLVRAAKYREIGGHEPIRLRPDDDVKLGKLFKLRGARCELMYGQGAVAVAWYHTVSEMIRGLTKNAFAGSDYRAWLPPLSVILVLALYLWPLAAIGLTTGSTWWCNVIAVVAMLWIGCDHAALTGGRRWYGLFLPMGMAVFSYILCRSMSVTYWTGGITWRGTHYPLAELKSNPL